MKKSWTMIAAILVLSLAVPASAQLQLPSVSQKASVMQRVGITDVTITYYRPGVKEREIWGGLVPYGEMWRTGANAATTIELSTDVNVNGHPVKAGRYSLFTIPGPQSWTVILNSVAELPGTSGYEAANDVARFEVTPQEQPFTEWMTFGFTEVSENSATAALMWEKLRVPFTIEAGTTERVLASARNEIAKLREWRIPLNAARYAFDAGVAFDEAMAWADQSIALNENYTNLSLKARMLASKGNYKEAIAAGEKAVKLGKAAERPVNTEATEKLIAEWKTKR
ncbi:MAG TPA: DUF2911 domain-containing protein [Thermoanaerobaculia bacterium]|nr:DUF2911 domain-containing protein [Thermoanaerobaculia bacterium]